MSKQDSTVPSSSRADLFDTFTFWPAGECSDRRVFSRGATPQRKGSQFVLVGTRRACVRCLATAAAGSRPRNAVAFTRAYGRGTPLPGPDLLPLALRDNAWIREAHRRSTLTARRGGSRRLVANLRSYEICSRLSIGDWVTNAYVSTGRGMHHEDAPLRSDNGPANHEKVDMTETEIDAAKRRVLAYLRQHTFPAAARLAASDRERERGRCVRPKEPSEEPRDLTRSGYDS